MASWLHGLLGVCYTQKTEASWGMCWPVASPFHSFVMTVVVMRMTKCIATSRERQNALN